MYLKDNIDAVGPVRATGLGDLGVLPDAIISVLTFYLDTRSICRLACCSKLWRLFAYESPLWMDQALRGHDGPVTYKETWRQTALCIMYHAAKAAAEAQASALHHLCTKAAAGTSTEYPSDMPLTAHAQPPPPRNTASLQKLQHLVQHLAFAVAAAVQPVPPVPDFTSDFLYRRWYRSNVSLVTFFPPVDQVPRVQHATLNPGDFLRCYDMPAQPVILTGFMDAEWPAGWQDHWQLDNLTATYGTTLFKASRPSGGKTCVRFSDYVDYMLRQTDEDPLYIFDEGFGEAAPAMLEWYKAPSVMHQDFTQLLEPSARPPYRWLVLGPARAGASWHVDPALTCAWNALTAGLKRWALYPPHIKPPGLLQLQQTSTYAAAAAAVAGSAAGSSSSSWCTTSATADDVSDCDSSSSSGSWRSSSSSSSSGESDDSPGGGLTSLQWYLEVYPLLPPHMRPYEFVQHPGEIVFVPGGWWHCVLNLEPSVAVTQNFVSQANFERVIAQSAAGSRAYHEDPLRFYKPQWRPWVAAWEEHQRQQWQQQHRYMTDQQRQQKQCLIEQQQRHLQQQQQAMSEQQLHHHQQHQLCMSDHQQQQVGSSDHGPRCMVQNGTNNLKHIGNFGPCEIDVTPVTAAAAAAATGAGPLLSATIASAAAAAAANSYQPALQPLPISVKVRPSPLFCNNNNSSSKHDSSMATCNSSSSSSSSSGNSSNSSSNSAVNILAADIYCHGGETAPAAATTVTAAAANVNGDAAWPGLLSAVAGGRGYLGSRLIGQLLKRIWEQQLLQQQEGCLKQQQQQQQQGDGVLQSQQVQLAEIATEWLAQREWQQLLGVICEVHGVCSARELDHELIFPEGGADSLVFTVRDVVVKFLVGQQDLPGELAAAAEARTLLLLQQQQQEQQQQYKPVPLCGTVQAAAGQLVCNTVISNNTTQPNKPQACTLPTLTCPNLVGHGAVHVSNAITESTPNPVAVAAATAIADVQHSCSSSSSSKSWHVPYVVLARVQGQGTAATLKHKLHNQQKQQLAWSCGQLLAALHKLPVEQTCDSSSSTVQAGCSSSSTEAGYSGSSSSAEAEGKSSSAEACGSGNSSSSSGGGGSSAEACGGGTTHCSSADQPAFLLQQLLQGSFWRDRAGNIWSSQLGYLDVEQQQQHRLAGGGAAHALEDSAAAAAAGQVSYLHLTQQQDSKASCCGAAAGLWQPFLQFQQQRRREVLQQLVYEQSWLADLGVVASEVYARFSSASDSLATAQQQRRPGGSSSMGPGGSSSSMYAASDCTANSSACHACCSTECTATGVTPGIGSTAPDMFPVIGVGDGCLPCWLVQQLADYIPQDMGSLVGVPTTAAAAGAGLNGGCSSSNQVCSAAQHLPCVLHGDLMAGNIILQLAEAQLALQGQQQGGYSQQRQCRQQQQQQCQQHQLYCSGPAGSSSLGLQGASFIDFADGGMGDPLYDFVAVFVSVLDCDPGLLEIALESYSSSIDVATVWPARPASVGAAATSCSTAAVAGQAASDLAPHNSINCTSSDSEKQFAPAKTAARMQPGWKHNADVAYAADPNECSVSKAFMCYILLHEEGVLGQLFEEHPQLRCAASLQELQQQLFGWMDVWWSEQVLSARALVVGV